MTLRTLRALLGLEDLSEFTPFGGTGVLGPPATGQEPGLWAAWQEAERESEAALQAWGRDRSGEAYAVYRAAADRADAAQAALARGMIDAA